MKFYHDPLWPLLLCLVRYETNVHKLTPNGFTIYLSLILNLYLGDVRETIFKRA